MSGDRMSDEGEIEYLVNKLRGVSRRPEELSLVWSIASKETEKAYAQLFRYASDLQKLLSMQKVSESAESEKDAAYAQLEQYSKDFYKLLEDRETAYDQLAAAHLDTIRRLTVAAEYKDDDTGVHIVRMSEYSALIARTLGRDDNFSKNILMASPMHDIGKIGIPDYILQKPGKLTVEEWAIMKKHPEYGAKILAGSNAPTIQLAAEIALTHHEKYDGSGYPNGLKGDEIPISGRVAAVADVFDALTMNRSYRPAMSEENAIAIIEGGRASHFDPEIVDAFLSVSDEIVETREQINVSEE